MLIYKILRTPEWAAFETAGRTRGAPVDLEDGFIHFSTGGQVEQTVLRHFAQDRALVLLAIETAWMGDALRWEPARGGALFPHLYGELNLADVIWSRMIPDGPDGPIPPTGLA